MRSPLHTRRSQHRWSSCFMPIFCVLAWSHTVAAAILKMPLLAARGCHCKVGYTQSDEWLAVSTTGNSARMGTSRCNGPAPPGTSKTRTAGPLCRSLRQKETKYHCRFQSWEARLTCHFHLFLMMFILGQELEDHFIAIQLSYWLLALILLRIRNSKILISIFCKIAETWGFVVNCSAFRISILM